MQNKIIIVTHDGKFHTDDVFAVATLRLALGKKEIEVIRTREEEWFKKGDYVLDVGFIYDSESNRFDHHQQGGAGERENGIPYASFGLIWQKFGKKLCGSQEAADLIDKKLVSYIDATDNGMDIVEQKFSDTPVYSITEILSLFRPAWVKEEKDKDQEFLSAVDWAQKILSLEIESADYTLGIDKSVEERYKQSEDKQLIVFSGEGESFNWEVPASKLSEYPEPLYFIMFKKKPEEWQVIAVRKNKKAFDLRKSLPEKWGGLSGKELEEVTGVPGALFCHRGKFMCVANSKEAAIKLAQLALEN